MPEYDEILKENIRNQFKVVKFFQGNIEIRKKLKDKLNMIILPIHLGHVTGEPLCLHYIFTVVSL